MQWNARGLIGKWAEAKQMFTNDSFQIVCIQETHFIENDRYSFTIPRFTLYSEFAPQGDRRGGVSIYASNMMPHRRIVLRTDLQAVACSINAHNRRISVCSLYLPPNDRFSFQDIDQLISQLPAPFLICTDANSKHFLWGSDHCDLRGQIWSDIVNHYNIHILNDGQPTRLDESTGVVSHIDITLASSDIAPLFDWNTDKDLHCSDHFPIHICYNQSPPLLNIPPLFTGWNVRKANWTMFQSACDIQFDDNAGIENCDVMTQTIIDTAQNFIPTRNGNSKYQCPWWTNECKEAIKHRRRAQNRMRRDTHSQFLRIEYRRVKAHTQRVIKQAKRMSWLELLSVFNHRTPMSKLWDILRKFSHKTRTTKPYPVIIQQGYIIDDPKEVVNAFGVYFEELSSSNNYTPAFRERERELTQNMPDFESESLEHYNMEFTFRELKYAISRSGSTSVGPDRVHYDFLRHMTDLQLQQLLKMYNYIWTHDVFPTSWRHSYVVPILKPGKNPDLVSSYRPIQLTSCTCKIMERMISKRLSWCIERYELLSKYQCAFRPRRSTADHLVRLDSHIREGFLHHASTLAVFLDIKSAYNLVNPSVLLHRMYHVGFRGHIMHFIQNFLKERTFQVRSGTLSDTYKQDNGIVQGGVISPILFNLAIDSLVDELPQGIQYAVYADDITIWVQGRRVPKLIRKMQRALIKVGEWSKANGFTFSSQKSNAILFRRNLRRIDLTTLPPLSINDETIPVVEEVKYLGVILDCKLNLNSHVEYLKSRVHQRMSVLKCVAGKSYSADRTILLRMYKAMIRPIIEYASFILDGPGNRRVESLEAVQNAALRVVTGALRTSPVRALQVDTDTMPLSLRRTELLLRYYLKVLGDQEHPCHFLSELAATAEMYRDLSVRYLRRISGLSVSYRIMCALDELNYDPPDSADVSCPQRRIPPWTLSEMSTQVLDTDVKKHRTLIDIQTCFQELLSQYTGYRILYTDGSKRDRSVACAFTINNAFFQHKLREGLSVYTAELVAIHEALKYVRTHRVPKSLICTDSQSAVKALASMCTDQHPIIGAILELNHRISRVGQTCIVVWVPGHSGIAGNVRADYWAGKAHDKPDFTRVDVGHQEYVPDIKECIRDHFASLWRDYRHTHLKLIKPEVGNWTSCVRAQRKEEVGLCRLRLGHTRLTHSFIMDHVPAPECDTCHCRLDVGHVLIGCQRYRAERLPLKQVCRNSGLPFSLETLLGDGNASVLDAVFAFLRECDLIDKL